MKDIKKTMLAEFDAFISSWKKMHSMANWKSNNNAEGGLYNTWFIGAITSDLEQKIVTISANLANVAKYDPPKFSMENSTYDVTNAKGRYVPFLYGGKTLYASADKILSWANGNQMWRMLDELEEDTKYVFAGGKKKEDLSNWDDKFAPGIGKWYWPTNNETFIKVAPSTALYLSWSGGLKLETGVSALGGSSSLGGGISSSDLQKDSKRNEEQTLSRKWCFWTVASVEQGAGDTYNQFTATTVEVPVGGGTQAVAVQNDKQSLPGSSGLFTQGSKVPVASKVAGQLEALQKILNQYSNIKSIKVQGSASWEWTNGRDDAQNLALAKIRAEWFINQLNAGTNKVASMWMPSETDKVVNGVKQIVGDGAIVQPTNDTKTAPDWRVTNFYITGDKVTERELPTEWIKTTETGDITLKYDKVTITEHLIKATWQSPGLITSKGWGQEKGKKDIKADLKQSTKWDDLKAGQEIVINDKSDPPKPVGGGKDGKQIFVVGEGTEKNTLKVKLVTTKDGQKSEKEIDNVSKERYLREIKPEIAEGEDNL